LAEAQAALQEEIDAANKEEDEGEGESGPLPDSLAEEE